MSYAARFSGLGGLTFFAAFFAALVITPSPSQAHQLSPPYLWFNMFAPPAAVYAITENRTASYFSSIQSATLDYNNNTDLHVDGPVGPGGGGNIVFLQANYGNTGWNMLANPFSGPDACADFAGNLTGICNTTTRKADFAYIYANDNYGPVPGPEFAMRHETGHVFGLAHTGCGTWSVMMVYACGTVPGFLTSHDISDINSWY
jgi:hypothetical protein